MDRKLAWVFVTYEESLFLAHLLLNVASWENETILLFSKKFADGVVTRNVVRKKLAEVQKKKKKKFQQGNLKIWTYSEKTMS